MSNFNIYPAYNGPGASQALESATSNFSEHVDASTNIQTLVYSYDVSTSPIVPESSSSLVVNIGKTPSNGILLVANSFSSGITGEVNGSSISLDSILKMGSVLATNASEGSSSQNARIVTTEISYPEFAQGEWSPAQPYHPIAEVLRSNDLDGTYLNLEFRTTLTDTVILTSGYITVQLFYIQTDSNNTPADGYPSGGVPVGPSPDIPVMPTPGPLPPITPPVPPEPVSNLEVVFDLLPPGSPGYNQEYKPTFIWTLPPTLQENVLESLTSSPDYGNESTGDVVVDTYMNWIMFQLTGASWTQISKITHHSVTASTPLGILLNPFPFLYVVNEIYRIQIETVVHRQDYPEQTASSFLVFGGDPYPTPPPPVINPPGLPENLVGVGGQYEISLSWDPPTDSGGALVTAYAVEQAQDDGTGAPGIFTPVANPTPSETYIVIENLLDSTKYYYIVAAINSVGTGQFTDPSFNVDTGPEPAGKPGIPRDLVAVGRHQQVQLTWVAPINDGGKAIDYYEVQQSTLPSPYTWVSLPTIDALKMLVTSLSNNTKYWYHVAAHNSEGSSPYSSPVDATTTSPTTTPGPPIWHNLVPGPAQVSLSWEAPADTGGSPIIDYKVEKAPDSPPPLVWSTVALLDALATVAVGLTAGVKYWFRISATNDGANYGTLSELRSETPTQPASLPGPPQDFTGDGGVKELTVQWKPPANLGGSAISAYTVEMVTGVSPTQLYSAGTDLKKTIVTYSGNPLVNNTQYLLKVRATNTTGDGPYTAVITVKTNPAPPVFPSAPINLQAQGLLNSIYLTWTPQANGGALILNYNLQRANDNGAGLPVPPFNLIATVPALSDPTEDVVYLNDSLPPLTTYHYRVAATNSVGTGTNSGEAMATTRDTATVPDAPTLDTLKPGITKIEASWTPGGNGGSALTQYNLQKSSTSATTGFAPAGTITVPTTTGIITGLTASTKYWVQVNAENSVGTGEWSIVKETTTSSASGNCDGTCVGTPTQWDGTAKTSQPVPAPGATPLADDKAYGAEIFWSPTGMTFGIQKSALPTPGPGCVDEWTLEVFEGTTLVATYDNPKDKVIAPRNFYILGSIEGPHGKDPTVFFIKELKTGTAYTLKCIPQPSTVTPICNTLPPLIIPFTTGVPVTPPSTDCDALCKGTAIQWNGTITTTVPKNGTDKDHVNNVGCDIMWSKEGLKYVKCVEKWTAKVLQTKTSTTPLAEKDFTSPQEILITNFSDTSDWVIASLHPSITYYIEILPIRNGITPGCPTPPVLGPRPFKMGNPYSSGPPSPPVPTIGNLPQTYITTYGLPSWGKTGMSSLLSQVFYSNGTPLAPKDSITTQYSQHQSWCMTRNWAKNFFQPYVNFISQNEEISNAMILIGDWLPITPGSGLPVQTSTLDATSGSKYGQVAGSNVLWDISKAIYSYCAPNGPVNFGLSYNPDNTKATPPASVGTWWPDDPDMMGCPLILDFLIPLALQLKNKGPKGADRIVEISVNGDVSKNGNDGAYGSYDCGNYTAADQRLKPSSPSSATLECILDETQNWIATTPKLPGNWGPAGTTSSPVYKTQTIQFTVDTQAAFDTLKNGDGKAGNPVCQNNQGGLGLGTQGKVSSTSPTYDSGTKLAIFYVEIAMMNNPIKPWGRIDGGFTISNTNASVTPGRGDAKVYFKAQADHTIANPTTVGTLYPVLSTAPAVGIFLNNWVVQQSAKSVGGAPGVFAATSAKLDPANIDAGGVIGQIAGNSNDSWEKFFGSAIVSITLSPGVSPDNVRPLLASSPEVVPSTYDTSNPSDPNSLANYRHRVYFVNSDWDPNKDPIPAPTTTTKIYDLRIGSVSEPPAGALPAIFNYGTLLLKSDASVTGGAVRRALGDGVGNETTGDGGWLPTDWNAKSGDTHFPSYWNVSPNTKNLPILPDGTTTANMDVFGPPGSLIMGGGNVFIGNGTGAYSGRGSYFDPATLTLPTTRPGLVTMSGIGTGKKGTYFTYEQGTPAITAGRVGFPLDNLHQLYITIYRINQQIMKYNYHHAQLGYSGPNPKLVLPLISHVHHDKESYQVNKTPEYPVCDSVTGEIEKDWLTLYNTIAQINAMSFKEYDVWKRSRRQTSVAYEKYLYNRYMPAQYLPDWRTAGQTIPPSYNMPHNTGCLIPNTGDRHTDGYSQINGEVLWDTTNKPWNVDQQRNFGLEALPLATSTSTAQKGIGNYSNNFQSRVAGDAKDGIQRYNMGWVNYAVTAWAFAYPPGQTVKLTCSALAAPPTVGKWVTQSITGVTGKVAATPAPPTITTFYVTVFNGGGKTGFTEDPVDIFQTPSAPPIPVVVLTADPLVLSFTSQGTNEAYQELYNIGEVKPPVDLIWLFDNSTVDPVDPQKPNVPTPNVTVNASGLSDYIDGTLDGVMVDKAGTSTAVTAVIDSIYNTSSIVLKDSSITFPDMFSNLTQATLIKGGFPNLVVSITAVYSPTVNGPFPSDFIKMHDYQSNNDYGVSPYDLPTTTSGTMIPNGLGSACIPGGSAPTCPGPGKSVFCPHPPGGGTSTSVASYYRLNAVTNTLIARIFDKYGGVGDWPFLGKNAVNVGSNIASPALTDIWQRYDAINTGVIPLDGRGFKEDGNYYGPGDHDGSFAPFNPPYVTTTGSIDLKTLYSNTTPGQIDTVSGLDSTKIVVHPPPATFKEPVGPREAIALFANEYIGGSLTLDPTARPGTPASGWLPAKKGEPTAGTLGPEYLPGSVSSWVGSRGMEVMVYANLTTNNMNLAFKNTNGAVSPIFSKGGWKLIIQTNKVKAQGIFKNEGWSFASNNWGGEYNGLAALQGAVGSKVGYTHMKDFLKSCASMMTGPKNHEMGRAKVGLYTIGFIPETWLTSSTV